MGRRGKKQCVTIKAEESINAKIQTGKKRHAFVQAAHVDRPAHEHATARLLPGPVQARPSFYVPTIQPVLQQPQSKHTEGLPYIHIGTSSTYLVEREAGHSWRGGLEQDGRDEGDGAHDLFFDW